MKMYVAAKFSDKERVKVGYNLFFRHPIAAVKVSGCLKRRTLNFSKNWYDCIDSKTSPNLAYTYDFIARSA